MYINVNVQIEEWLIHTYYQIVSQLNDKETKEFFNIFLSNIV